MCIPLDSKEGITAFLRACKTAGFVIHEGHEATARKWDVPIPEGLIVSRPLPLSDET